jgi:hypothetical protein
VDLSHGRSLSGGRAASVKVVYEATR